ncbi:PSP1 domain-containing protein [Mailhella sp.]
MKQTLGIRFSKYGQVLACLCDAEDDAPLSVGEYAIVTTEQGLHCGKVAWQRPWQEDMEAALKAANAAIRRMGSNLDSDDSGEDGAENSAPMPTARRATDEERMAADGNALLSREAYAFCRQCIGERGLDMKLVDVEVLFDRSKMIFYFTAPTRIDFRDLVKDLVRQYRTRIELRQIGVRHETQMLGALGNCGMVCCCRRYLHKFAPVTIKMAKEQNLFLNPAKISGICGRLLCCLSYEQENYDSFHRSCPKLGKRYQTTDGPMRVLRSNMFRNSVVVLPDGGQELEMTLEEWQALKPSRAETPAVPQSKEQKPQQNSMMVVSAAPETLEDVLAELAAIEPEAEAASAPSREVTMLDSEEAQHKKKPRHHPSNDHEKSRRPRTGRDKGRHTAESAAHEDGER